MKEDEEEFIDPGNTILERKPCEPHCETIGWYDGEYRCKQCYFQFYRYGDADMAIARLMSEELKNALATARLENIKHNPDPRYFISDREITIRRLIEEKMI